MDATKFNEKALSNYPVAYYFSAVKAFEEPSARRSADRNGSKGCETSTVVCSWLSTRPTSGAVLQRRPGENRPAIPEEPQEGRQRRGRAAGRHAGAAGNVAVAMRRYETHPENGLAMMRGRFSVSGGMPSARPTTAFAMMRGKIRKKESEPETGLAFIVNGG